MNPIAATARLYLSKTDKLELLGTCFAYRNPGFYLTAAHCIGSLPLNALIVARNDGTSCLIGKIHLHGNADLAILECSHGLDNTSKDFFWDSPANYDLGEYFFAFGFPELNFTEASAPVARTFAGTFQRFYQHQSHLKLRGENNGRPYSYLAGELSIPCPGGLSGGPVFRRDAPPMLLGVVTENVEASTLLHSFEETQENGNLLRTEYNRVLTYGVCVMTAPYKDWLNEHIPNARARKK